MRNKVARFEMKMSFDELEKLKRDSAKAGISKSEYVRRLIMNYIVKERPDDRFYEVMRQLTAIGNNLNQIAHKANYLNEIDKDLYMEEKTNWNRFMKEIKVKYL